MESGWIDKQPPTVSITISFRGAVFLVSRDRKLLKLLFVVEKTKHEAGFSDTIKSDRVFLLSL
jgi:hypothetical protein